MGFFPAFFISVLVNKTIALSKRKNTGFHTQPFWWSMMLHISLQACKVAHIATPNNQVPLKKYEEICTLCPALMQGTATSNCLHCLAPGTSSRPRPNIHGFGSNATFVAPLNQLPSGNLINIAIEHGN